MRVSRFMDYTKIQQDVIKMCLEGKMYKYHYGITTIDDEERVTLILDGNVAIFIPKPFYLLNNDAIFKDSIPLSEGTLSGFVKMARDAENITPTARLETYELKRTIRAFENDGEDIWVDTKLLDMFKSAVEINYKGTTKKSPVFIYCYNDLIGMIMPVVKKEEEE